MCQNVSQVCLLSLADYRKLLQGQETHSVEVTPETFVDDVEGVPVSQSPDISVQHANDIVTDDNIINHVNGVAHDTLALSQVNVESDVLSLDDSLSTADSVAGMGSSRTVLDLEDGSRTKNRGLGLGLGLEEVWPWPLPQSL